MKFIKSTYLKQMMVDSYYHPAQAKKSPRPKSSLPLAKLYKYVYIITVGSATPNIKRGCPPRIACMIPQIAVEAKVSTVLKLPSEQNKISITFKLIKENRLEKIFHLVPIWSPRKWGIRKKNQNNK